MKFRLAAAIALYFLLTLLFSTLSNASSREKQSYNHTNCHKVFQQKWNSFPFLLRIRDQKTHNHANRRKVFEKKWKTFSQLLIGIHKPRITQTSLLPQRKNNILSLVIDKCLTCRDIIVLRQTCKDFQYLLHPNDINMVTFCVYGLSKTITNTNIIWEDLKYFMKQNYYSAFYEMKMFNIKENEYAVLTRMPDEKYIVWSNESIPYFFYKMLLDILDKTKQIIPLHDYHERYFENKKGNAWAIITKERNVKTSGNTNDGGDSSIVQSQLVNVKIIFSTNDSFAALLDNGTVVAWGDEDFGGKIPDEIQIQLVNVKMIASTATAFAALLGNGTIVAWGNEAYGGTIPRDIQNKMIKNVKMIRSTGLAFATLLNDGTVVGWGFPRIGLLGHNDGGEIPRNIQKQMIKNVKMIFSNCCSFAALLNDDTVVSWGAEDYKIPAKIQTQLVNVKMISSTDEAFAALLDNGTVIAWGNGSFGGKIPRDIEKQMIKNVNMIFSTSSAFSALLNDGTVVAWGSQGKGGKIPDNVQIQLIDIKQIIPQRTKFIALCENGKIFTWGHD